MLLHWGHVGWIHLFSTEPVAGPDDLRELKQFVWAGGPDAGRYWKKNGFKPVPLAVSDIPMGIETGLIEAFPAPPLSALAFQWYRSAPYMLDVGAAPYIGATVSSKKVWKKLSADDQATMLEAAARVEQSLDNDVPLQEKEAIEEMKKRGLTVVAGETERESWQTVADRFAQQMGSTDVPADIFAQVEKLRKEYRAR